MTDRRDEEQAASSMLLATADSDDRASNPSPMAMESLSSAIHTGNRELSGAGENSPPANLARNHLAPPHFPFKRHYLAAPRQLEEHAPKKWRAFRSGVLVASELFEPAHLGAQLQELLHCHCEGGREFPIF